jgi:MoxR-like ATPase
VGARGAEICCHRDLRDTDWLGDATLRRWPHGHGERIARGVVAGPVLHAEVLVLDDLDRAPGSALGPLLPLLAQRRMLGRELPLETAIATATPPGLAVYGEAIEAGVLDRFAIQIRMRGAIVAGDGALARAILSCAGEDDEPPGGIPVLDTRQRHALQARAAALAVTDEARRGLFRFGSQIARLVEGSAPAIAISDRAFSRFALAVMRAHALLRGGDRVTREDLRALRYLLARRVPAGVIDETEAIAEDLAQPSPRSLVPWAAVAESATRTGEGGAPSRAMDDAGPARHWDVSLEPARGRACARPTADADVSRLLRAIEGRIERGGTDREDHPGGAPRGQRRMRRLDEILDADPLEAGLFVQGLLPGGPHVPRRQRRDASGALAVLRDVSASMEGRLSVWTGQIVTGLVRVARRRRMRMGYIEFHHEAERFVSQGRFFHRGYEGLLALAARRRAEGRTSYEAPLRAALDAFRRTPGGARHAVLLTDGVPVAGDPWIVRERARARGLGVAVHTVFVGLGECPAVLDVLSLETRGLRLRAIARVGGRVEVCERETSVPAVYPEACA